MKTAASLNQWGLTEMAMTLDPSIAKNYPAQICPPAPLSSASTVLTWPKMGDFAAPRPSTTLLSIGERSAAKIWSFRAPRFVDLRAGGDRAAERVCFWAKKNNQR